jgi:predicted RNase H-like HicB family nuclease
VTERMDPQVDSILRKHYPVVVGIERDSDGREHFAAWLLDMPGCAAQADTREEALERLEAIKPAYLMKLAELGVTPTEPTSFPAIIPGPAWFADYTGQPKQAAPGELPEPQLGGAWLLRVVAV